jgi:hypothetical protein
MVSRRCNVAADAQQHLTARSYARELDTIRDLIVIVQDAMLKEAHVPEKPNESA